MYVSCLWVIQTLLKSSQVELEKDLCHRKIKQNISQSLKASAFLKEFSTNVERPWPPSCLSVFLSRGISPFSLLLTFNSESNQLTTTNKIPAWPHIQCPAPQSLQHRTETGQHGRIRRAPLQPQTVIKCSPQEGFWPTGVFKDSSQSLIFPVTQSLIFPCLTSQLQKPLQLISVSFPLNGKLKYLFFYHSFSCDLSFLFPKVAIFPLIRWAQLRSQSSSRIPQCLAPCFDPSFLQ